MAVEVGDGASVLVGPDNGLLAPAVALVGGRHRAVELTEPAYQLEAPGATFAGRDVFAPAAAHLCVGVDLLALGPEIDPAGLLPSVLPISHLDETGALVAEVLWVDRFGNAQLNVDPDEVEAFGDRVRLRLGDDVRTARVVRVLRRDRVGRDRAGGRLLRRPVDRRSTAARPPSSSACGRARRCWSTRSTTSPTAPATDRLRPGRDPRADRRAHPHGRPAGRAVRS